MSPDRSFRPAPLKPGPVHFLEDSILLFGGVSPEQDRCAFQAVKPYQSSDWLPPSFEFPSGR